MPGASCQTVRASRPDNRLRCVASNLSGDIGLATRATKAACECGSALPGVGCHASRIKRRLILPLASATQNDVAVRIAALIDLARWAGENRMRSAAFSTAGQRALVASMMALLTGCGGLLPAASPSKPAASPSNPVPVPGEHFEIAVDNRSAAAFKILLWQGVSGPSMTVGPCEASSLAYAIDGPFSLRAGDPALGDALLPILASSGALPRPDGIRVIVRVAQDGAVSYEELVGDAPQGPPGEC